MRCNKEDCFHCPYPDCINDKPLSEYVYSYEQKKRNYERIKEHKRSCLWASEIEQFPIAVTKLRFGE